MTPPRRPGVGQAPPGTCPGALQVSLHGDRFCVRPRLPCSGILAVTVLASCPHVLERRLRSSLAPMYAFYKSLILAVSRVSHSRKCPGEPRTKLCGPPRLTLSSSHAKWTSAFTFLFAFVGALPRPAARQHVTATGSGVAGPHARLGRSESFLHLHCVPKSSKNHRLPDAASASARPVPSHSRTLARCPAPHTSPSQVLSRPFPSRRPPRMHRASLSAVTPRRQLTRVGAPRSATCYCLGPSDLPASWKGELCPSRLRVQPPTVGLPPWAVSRSVMWTWDNLASRDLSITEVF